jgi:hypothetical protein
MPSFEKLVPQLEEAIRDIPLLDAHTHMDAKHLAARGLDDVALYHMVISDLYSAGYGDGTRMDEWPEEKERVRRIETALPYYPAIQNCGVAWGLRIILKDLYGWKQPLAADNWRKLDAKIRERSGDPAWPRQILDRVKIRRTCTETWRGHDGSADDVFQYSLEWCFFARCQWGEFDAVLYDLENAWQYDKPQPPLPVTTGGKRPPVRREIRSADDADTALDHYFACIPFDRIVSTAQHVSTDINYIDNVTKEQFNKALANRKAAGPAEQDVYSSYLFEGFLNRMESRRKKIVFQFSFAAEPLPFESGSRIRQETLRSLANIIARHPGQKFQCFLASMHANQTLATFCRELPNLSLAGYWWHNFFPSFIPRIMSERLDMVSTNKLVGFFSDAYTSEWAYAKAVMVRKCLARVLAEKVTTGQYDVKLALEVARRILWETPQSLLGMVPKPEPAARRAKTRTRSRR